MYCGPFVCVSHPCPSDAWLLTVHHSPSSGEVRAEGEGKPDPGHLNTTLWLKTTRCGWRPQDRLTEATMGVQNTSQNLEVILSSVLS